MHAASRRPLHLLLLVGLLLASAWAGAAQRALLVGVSELANQPASLWLQAPRNDVLLMRDALARQGFAPADITVLADGVPGAALPDAQAIRDGLQRLLAQSRSGDFVVLYFSGHGTRVRDTAKRYQEPDGLAENFLARDVRGAIGGAGLLGGGMRDVDFDGWVQAFLAKNVFVWSVFDTCSAASMTRGLRTEPAQPAGDEVRWRGVRVDQLAAAAAPADDAVPAAPAAEAVARARYVAFFASESHQVTPELRLPRGDRQARPQGLLTWAVAQSLQRRPQTWRALFDGVLSLYPPVIDELAQRFPARELPSPVAEGNLDLPLFTNPAGAVTTRPLWPARRGGAMLALAAGQIDGLVARQRVRVTAVLDDGAQREAETELGEAGLDQSSLRVPDALQDVAGSALWRVQPVAGPAALALQVRAERPLPAGLSLAYPASIATGPDATADVRAVPAGGGGWRLELLAPELGGPAAAVTLPDAQALRQRLETLARLKWLARLPALAQGGRVDGLEVQIERWQGAQLLRTDDALGLAALPAPAEGQRMALNVHNTSGQSIDLAVIGIDAQGAMRAVYPPDGAESNRFERGTREQPAAKRFDLPWLAQPGAQLLVVAAPAAPYSGPRLFGAGPPEPVADLRVRGQLQPERRRAVYAVRIQTEGTAAAPAR
ncbi:MAG: peptidase C14 [Variovorax paradoxus]|uniref:Peptidase C14 n=1 Tax=Variovorax paradoxus TaxID=34073 RepID=A0A2W5QAZ8_VARPD|nr:MAG: peptidase C14 [Variovorax paradoxus]